MFIKIHKDRIRGRFTNPSDKLVRIGIIRVYPGPLEKNTMVL